MNSAEYKEIVLKSVNDIHDVIERNTKELEPKNKWLIYARIINLLFSQFYTPVVELTVINKMKPVIPEEKQQEFNDLVEPLIKFLNDYSPHHTIIIDPTSAVIVEGLYGFQTAEFVKD